MERAEFMHLLRLSEQASQEDSARYRRGVWLFAALGYAWVIGCLLLGAAILGGIAWSLMHGGRFRGVYVWAVMGAGALLWVSLRALWLRLEPPTGHELKRDDAPALFDLLERIRAKIKGPPIHRVLIDDDYNASIQQHPRFGLFGGAINTLTIGLPLLMALDTRRLAAVLAHEYGHLRGDHGRFAAWIYRSRLSWAKLHDGLAHDSGVASWATNAFLNWYFPRFSAKTFALARQDEYEADRIAGRIAGTDVAAAALTEVAVKGAWLREQFWPAHWRGAGTQPLPVGPFSAMRTLLAQPLDTAFAQDALRAELKALPEVDDTHPGLRDRLEALDAAKKLPDWSAKPAMGLLADRRRWVAQFDSAWCKANASAWKQHHANLARVRERLSYLKTRARSANAAATGMTHGAQFAVGTGNGGRSELEFARTTNGDVAAILAVLFHQFANSGKVVHAGDFGGDELGVILAHLKLPPLAFFRHVFHNNSQNAQTAQMTTGLTARVGFLDAFGERAFATNGNTVGIGAVGSAQQAGGKNKLVVGANGCAGGRNLTRNNSRGQRTAAKASVFLRDFFKNTGLGRHIDAQKTEHGAS